MQAQNTNNMATVAKTQSKKKKKPIISQDNQNKILHAYIALYNAFLLKHLLSGKTLGAASHSAIQMLRAKIATMDKKNPVTKLLHHIHAYHARVTAKHIMTNKFRDSRSTFSAETRAKALMRVSKLTNDSNKVLGIMTAQYKPKVKNVAKKPQLIAAQQKLVAKQNNPQNQKLIMQIWLQRQRVRSNAA